MTAYQGSGGVEQVPIAEQLCQALAGEPGEIRESANLGLRDLTETGLTDASTAQPVIDVLVPSLAAQANTADKHALTHLTTILTKFGGLCAKSHGELQSGLFGLFRPGMDATLTFLVTRCCCALIAAGTRSLVASMITTAFEQLHAGKSIFGEVIGKLAGTAGRRVGPLVPELLPKLIGLLESGDDDDALERQAGVLAAIAAIISVCPKQCKGADFTAQALHKASELLALADESGDLFDFSDDDDDDADADADADGGDEDGSDSDRGNETDENENVDDDDLTWKVRAAAAKCVAAVGLVPGTDAGPDVVAVLIDRVASESSTAVKMQIYSACKALLCASGTPETIAAFVDNVVTTDFMSKTNARVYALAALRSLAIERQGCLIPSAGVLCPGLCCVLGSTNSELRAAASGLVQAMIPSSLSEEQRGSLAPQVIALASALASCVKGSDGRVQVSALDSIACLAGACADETQAAALFEIASGGLTANDSNECIGAAIRATSRIVSLHGGISAITLKVKPFLERLHQCLDGDDTVRMTATDAVSIIASKTNGSVLLAEATGPLSAKLVALLPATTDQMQRRRIVGALAAIGQLNAAGIDGISTLSVVAPLVGPADIQLSAKVLQLCGSLLGSTPGIGPDLKRLVWPATFELLKNPSLNESARAHLVGFCGAVARANIPEFGFEFVLDVCVSGVAGKKVSSASSDSEIARYALKSLGACIGTMAAAAPAGTSMSAAERFAAGIAQGKQVNADQSWSCDEAAIAGVVLSLRSLGALGAKVDLSQTTHFQTVLECLEKQTSAEIRNAATACVTSLCRGNVDAFTPMILGPLQGDGTSKHGLQARVLQAIRKLALQAGPKLDRSAFIPVLLAATATANSEVRQGVGQCLGNMVTDTETIADFAIRATGSTDGAVTQTLVTAIQNAVRAGVVFDIGPFVALIDHDDLGVKEACLSLLSCAIRYSPEVAQPVIDNSLLQKVYACANFYSNLVQVVELGSMKHLVDRGLGVRRAAFEVVEALIFDEGGIAELVERDIENFVVAAGQGLESCAVILVTVHYEMGKDAGDVVIVPPNNNTGNPGGPAPGHAAFLQARVNEIAAATGLDPEDIEVENVSLNPEQEMKALGVVDVAFMVRVPDPTAAIAALKATFEAGQGTAVPVRAPIKQLLRPLDASAIQEVALVTVRAPLDCDVWSAWFSYSRKRIITADISRSIKQSFCSALPSQVLCVSPDRSRAQQSGWKKSCCHICRSWSPR